MLSVRVNQLSSSLAVRAAVAFALCFSALVLATPARAANPTFSYPDFSSIAGLRLNGTALQVNSLLRLTPSEPNRIGTVFSTTPIDTQQSFQTSFTIALHDGTEPKPADGMAFVVQNSPLGAGAISPSIGGSLGYNGISPSVAVEFDPYYNFEAADPPRPHISINPGTTGSHVACAVEGTPEGPCTATLPFPLYGAPLHVWLDYEPTTQNLRVFVDPTTTKPAAPLLEKAVPIGALGNSAFLGFTASTGGASAVQEVLSWTVGPEATPQPPPPPPVEKKKTQKPKKKGAGKCKGKSGKKKGKAGKGKRAASSQAKKKGKKGACKPKKSGKGKKKGA